MTQTEQLAALVLRAILEHHLFPTAITHEQSSSHFQLLASKPKAREDPSYKLQPHSIHRSNGFCCVNKASRSASFLLHLNSLGRQVDYRETDYKQFQPNAVLDSDGEIIANRFLWRF